MCAMAESIPERLVVLTFDDGKRTDIEFVAPLLERYGFGATFFISEGLGARDDKAYFMTWEEVRDLHERGFEIGNHTGSHPDVSTLERAELIAELDHIDRCCREYGIPRPRTFCYPGYHTSPAAVSVLAERGYAWARCGCEPTPADAYHEAGGYGPAYDPRIDHPLLVPTTLSFGPAMDFASLTWAAEQATSGCAAVFTFHGVPDPRHPWVTTEPEVMGDFVAWLADGGYSAIALGDLSHHLQSPPAPADPYAAQRSRHGIRFGPAPRT
jgi:peptidoglycan/xylan/chitin deacetylase (PgdA/CDA1 family)